MSLLYNTVGRPLGVTPGATLAVTAEQQTERYHHPSFGTPVPKRKRGEAPHSNPRKRQRLNPSTPMAPKRRRGGKRMRRRAPRRRISRRRKGRGRRRVVSSFPHRMAVKLVTRHQCRLNPGANEVAILSINPASPLDPISPNQVNTVLFSRGYTAVSAETHPKDWDIYETLYDSFRVISYRITINVFANQTATTGYALLAAPEKEATEIWTKLNTSTTGMFDIKNSVPGAIIRFRASTSSTPENLVFTKRGNIQKLEGHRGKMTEDLQSVFTGKTLSHSDGATAPNKAPKIYFAIAPFTGANDLGDSDVFMTLEQVVLFSKHAQRSAVAV